MADMEKQLGSKIPDQRDCDKYRMWQNKKENDENETKNYGSETMQSTENESRRRWQLSVQQLSD